MRTDPRPTYVIVGGGLAAAEAAKTLRADGFEGRLVVVAAEPHLPYERPALSKEYLRGDVGPDKLLAQPASFYEQEGVELHTGRRAFGIDLSTRTVALDDGHDIRFDRLLLATGARPVRPAIEGVDRPWVHLVRTLDDADRLRVAAAGAESAVVAGGGWIGAETAASLRQMGLLVTLVVPGRELLERQLGADVGAVLSELHERHGVRIVRNARVGSIVDGRVGRGVRTADGDVVVGDIVVLGFGALPAVELAAAAGLPVGDGILVDERLMTAAEGVYAAGDVASAWHPRYGRRVRSEHWDNARRQARTAARNLLGGSEAYERIPYFFSDQFELGLETIGRPSDGEEVLQRRDEAGSIALWLRGGRVVAGMHANVWDAKKDLDRLVSSAARIDARRFRDPDVPLGALLAAIAPPVPAAAPLPARP
jgi:3-phenylpropionate/trans-cinnamate dioxygenase ferredoxin reductase component